MAGALADVVDYVTFHYYGATENYTEQVQKLVESTPDKPLVLGEFGSSSWRWLRTGQAGEASQAAYLADLLAAQQLMTRQQGWPMAGEIVWTLYDFTAVPLAEFRMPWQKAQQANMGLLRSDGSWKPAAEIFASNSR